MRELVTSIVEVVSVAAVVAGVAVVYGGGWALITAGVSGLVVSWLVAN